MHDDKIRSMLESAEVSAPRRVWRNVAEQLDAAAAPSVYASGREWMKWGGRAVAFAALVAGVFLFVRQTSSVDEPIQVRQELLAEQSVQIPDEKNDVSDVSELFAEVTPAIPHASVVVESANEPAEEILSEEIIAEPVPETVSEAVPEATPGRVPDRIKPDGSAAEEFERMAREDEKKFSRGIKSLYAQGAIGGNDSDISFFTNRARMSSGTSVKKTGITELGESKYGIPVSIGVGFRYYVLPGFSVGSGLDYSLLSRTFTGLYERVNSGKVEYSETGTVHHAMHYLGIPLNAYYDIIAAERIKFYVYGGGELEFCVANNYSLYSSSGSYISHSSPVERLQWSVGAGLGVEFKLSDLVGLYLDPSAKYYFHCYQPKNIRTERPLMFNFDAGLRFNF